jgi:adenylate cyclase class 2
MPHLNVEIKAKCQKHDLVRSYLKAHHAEEKGTDHQIDTYFNVPTGRLKLREGEIENALIYYERSNQEGPKQAKVTIYRTEPGKDLKAVLVASLGILAVVDKMREIYFLENVKFHIDTVKNLGTFMEIEAIDEDGNIGQARLQAQCEQYLRELQIDQADLLPSSYSDMIMAQTAKK